MRITLKRAAMATILTGALALTGCVANPLDAETSDDPDVWGYVTSAENAQLEIAAEQLGTDELVVDRVLTPGDAWIVVHADDNGKPGMRIGLAHVDKGESTDVRVALEDVTTAKVIVAVHADRGKAGEFDFDMMNPTMSPDRPYFVDRAELALVVTVREFGVKTGDGTAAIEVADQGASAGTLTIDRALAPTDAWIVVHLDDEGAPGQRVGLLRIPAGETLNAIVELEPLPLTEKVFVAIHADRGEAGVFEFDMMNTINSADQPFFVDDEEVATAVAVK